MPDGGSTPRKAAEHVEALKRNVDEFLREAARKIPASPQVAPMFIDQDGWAFESCTVYWKC